MSLHREWLLRYLKKKEAILTKGEKGMAGGRWEVEQNFLKKKNYSPATKKETLQILVATKERADLILMKEEEGGLEERRKDPRNTTKLGVEGSGEKGPNQRNVPRGSKGRGDERKGGRYLHFSQGVSRNREKDSLNSRSRKKGKIVDKNDSVASECRAEGGNGGFHGSLRIQWSKNAL